MKFFSIIVVCLNAGDRLRETLDSILSQTCGDYEIILKDGGSVDGSVEEAEKRCRTEERLHLVREKDSGIYDAMNQAVRHADGHYLLFLNCGDSFYDHKVLERARNGIQKAASGSPGIYYGDVYEKKTGAVVASNPKLNAFACYRNIPCHQVCFYDRRLFEQRCYDINYRVRADYEHFLWCFFSQKAPVVYLPMAVASYEGGGFSETPLNRKISEQEHREITGRYLTKKQLILFRLALLLTLSPLRRKIAESRRLAGIYQQCKKLLYRSMKGR